MLYPSSITSEIFQWVENKDKLIQSLKFLNHKKSLNLSPNLSRTSFSASDFSRRQLHKRPHSKSWPCSVFGAQHEWNNTPSHPTASYIIALCIALFTAVATISTVMLPQFGA
jgi:hypothetical protein